MPSFDIVSEVELQAVDDAINQSRKELASRFDFKNSTAAIEFDRKEKITLTAEDAAKLKALHDILINRLAKRNVDLRNIDRKDPQISSIGNARQEIVIKNGLEGEKAKEIIKAIKAEGYKVQSALQDTQVRVTGKKRDDLQEVIAFLRGRDFGVALSFGNFRD